MLCFWMNPSTHIHNYHIATKDCGKLRNSAIQVQNSSLINWKFVIDFVEFAGLFCTSSQNPFTHIFEVICHTKNNLTGNSEADPSICKNY